MSDKITIDESSGSVEEKFSDLRKQATILLASQQLDNEQPLDIQEQDIEKIIEELRVYHAELEIQNTELQQAILAKETIKKHYEKLFHQSPLPALILDSKGVIQEVNDVATTIFKIIRPLQRKRSIYPFLSRQSALEINELLLNNNVLEHKYLKLDISKPEQGYFDCALTKLEITDSKEAQFLLMMRDVSAERALEQEKNIFDQVVNNSSDIIFVLNSKLQLVASNFLANQHFDLAPNKQNQLINMYHVLPEKVIKACEHVLSESSGITRHHSVTYKQAKTNGLDVTEQHFYCRLCSIPSTEDPDDYIAITITNETSRLYSEIQLDIAAEMFKNSNQAIMITYSNGEIASINNAFEKITGFNQEDVLGQNPKILSSGSQRPEFYKQMWNSLLTQGRWQGEIWNKRKNGEQYPQWLSITKVNCGEAQDFRYLALFDDISNIKASEKAIKELSYHDQLTQLGNRHSLQLELKERIAKYGSVDFCLMFIDLDYFKVINDTQGLEVGDQLLQHVAKRLNNVKRSRDKIFRVGGDEFVLIFPLLNREQAAAKANQINSALQEPYFINGRENDISCSIGIVNYPEDASSPDELLKNADIALYDAKHTGRNCFVFFSNIMASKVERNLRIEQELKKAISEQTLSFACQPLVKLKDKTNASQELLLRWPDSPIDNINIEEMINIAEQNGTLIKDISKLAIATALEVIEAQNIRVGVNLSSHDFEDTKHFEQLIALCQAKPEQTKYLDIEITERTVMNAPEKVAAQLSTLRQLGIQILVDDFGTGYSSFIYLRSFPVDGIKIDRAFINNITDSDKDVAIVKTIILLCKSLGLLSIAEGVETKEQAEALKELGCDIGQGYFFSKPQLLLQR